MKKSINLNSKEWNDFIFSNKNQLYGAYEMRMSSSKRHIAALGFAALFAIAIAGIPLLISSATSNNTINNGITDTYTLINLIDKEDPKVVVVDVDMPEPPSLRSQVLNTVAYVVPVIGDDDDIPDDLTPPTVDDILADDRAVGYINVNEGTNDPNAERLREDKTIVDEIIVDEGPRNFVEVMPQFPGGETEMMRYIKDNLKYPAIDQEIGNYGRVIIRFVVSKTGEIDQIQVVKGISPSADREATRVVKNMPKWIPGRQNGVAVAVYFTLPIHFVLRQ